MIPWKSVANKGRATGCGTAPKHVPRGGVTLDIEDLHTLGKGPASSPSTPSGPLPAACPDAPPWGSRCVHTYHNRGQDPRAFLEFVGNQPPEDENSSDGTWSPAGAGRKGHIHPDCRFCHNFGTPEQQCGGLPATFRGRCHGGAPSVRKRSSAQTTDSVVT